MLAGRYLGVEGFGKFTFALILVTTISLISDFGLMEFAKRSVARDPGSAETYFGNIFTWKIVLSAIAIIISIVAIRILKSEPDIRMAVYILGFAAMLKSLKIVPLTFFQALERFDLSALCQWTHNLGILICGAIALYLGAGLIAFALVFTIFKLFDTAVTYVIAHKKTVCVSLKCEIPFIKKLQVAALPFGIIAIIVEVYVYADTIMLGILKNDTEVGLFTAAFKIYEGLTILPLILYQAFSPHLSRLFKQDMSEHFKLGKRVIKFSVMISIPVTVCGIALSNKIIPLLYGEQFHKASIGLMIMLLGFMFTCLNYAVHAILISIDQQKILAPLMFIGLMINVGINLILIPRYGYLGAASTTVIATMMVFILGYVYLGKVYGWCSLLRILVKPLLAVLTISGFYMISNIKIQILHLIVIVPSYAMLLVLYKAFYEDELSIVKRFIIPYNRNFLL
jgi:O-antigen/teichoic acid export membrane protein